MCISTLSTPCVSCVEAGLLIGYSPQLFCIVLLYLQPFLHKLCIALQEVDAPLSVLVEVLKLVLREEEREHRWALSAEEEVREFGLSQAFLSKTGYMKKQKWWCVWWILMILLDLMNTDDFVGRPQTANHCWANLGHIIPLKRKFHLTRFRCAYTNRSWVCERYFWRKAITNANAISSWV